MGYKGRVYTVPCMDGGLTGNPNTDLISPNMMVSGTKNLNIHEGGRAKRGGTAKATAAISGTPQIVGIYDFKIPGGTQYIVFGTNDGKIYKDATNTITTGLTANKLMSFEVFDKELYCFNGHDVPHKWTGAGNTAALSDIPTDWTGTNFPSQIIRHGKGNSERMWAIGCPTTPYTIYVSPDGDGDDFSDANVITFNIDTGDSLGLRGAGVMVDDLIMFGNSRSYIIDDNDTDTANWGYDQAAWSGGVAHHRLLVKTPSDIVAMVEDGEIYSVRAAQEYGDYKRASLTRKAWIHKWIKDNLDLSKISQFHGVYDPILQAIKYFVVRSGETTVDMALVYFINEGVENGWMIHDNLNFTSGYSAVSSALVRVGMGDYQVYTGGYSGYIWKLEQSTKSDDSNAIYGGFKSPPMDFNDPKYGGGEKYKNYKRLRLVIDPQGTEVITIDWWVNGTSQSAKTITAVSGTTDYVVELGAIGQKIQYAFYNNTAAKDFFISQFKTDFKYLGAKPS